MYGAFYLNATVNGHLELTLLKGRQRFENFEISESSPILILGMMNLHLILFEAWWILNERVWYCFIIFFISKWILA